MLHGGAVKSSGQEVCLKTEIRKFDQMQNDMDAELISLEKQISRAFDVFSPVIRDNAANENDNVKGAPTPVVSTYTASMMRNMDRIRRAACRIDTLCELSDL